MPYGSDPSDLVVVGPGVCLDILLERVSILNWPGKPDVLFAILVDKNFECQIGRQNFSICLVYVLWAGGVVVQLPQPLKIINKRMVICPGS